MVELNVSSCADLAPQVTLEMPVSGKFTPSQFETHDQETPRESFYQP